MWSHIFVTSALGCGDRQAGPWSLLVSQCSWISQLEAHRDTLSQEGRHQLWNWPSINIKLQCMCTHIQNSRLCLCIYVFALGNLNKRCPGIHCATFKNKVSVNYFLQLVEIKIKMFSLYFYLFAGRGHRIHMGVNWKLAGVHLFFSHMDFRDWI